MSEVPLCVVCCKPILPGDKPLGGEDVHTACDRRKRVRETVVKCIVCNEVIGSQDGTARLGNVLVHGTCYVRARQPEGKAPARSANRSAPDGGWAQRLLRRVFGSRSLSR